MVNDPLIFGVDPAAGHPERALALGYAPAAVRHALAALFALDTTFARITYRAREPIVAQMRLAWWHEALCALAEAPPPAHPILRALHATIAPRGPDLATMIDGWELLLDAPEEAALETFADSRGALFSVAAELLGAQADDPVGQAGRGWALADLARAGSHGALGDRAAARARPLLDRATKVRWSMPSRALGALALSARMDLDAASAVASPRRVARLAWHRMTGR